MGLAYGLEYPAGWFPSENCDYGYGAREGLELISSV